MTKAILSGNEPFHDDGEPLGLSVLDFWRWSASELNDNALRGILAEFLVASALQCTLGARSEWQAYDLISPDGIKVEVKSAAYVQVWHQQRLSPIIFGIQETHAWVPETGQYASQMKRQADVYTFALLTQRNRDNVDPLNLAQWAFFVLPTYRLPPQKSLGLNRLRSLQPLEATYDTLSEAVHVAYNQQCAVERDGASPIS